MPCQERYNYCKVLTAHFHMNAEKPIQHGLDGPEQPVQSGPLTDQQKFSGMAWLIQSQAGIRE